MVPEISPEWVQAGELGLAFVVVILCTCLVLYVMKTSASREKTLMDTIRNQTLEFAAQTAMFTKVIQEQSGAMKQVVRSLNNLDRRTEAIENTLEIAKAMRARSTKRKVN